jgi:hypothetical protein
MPGNACGPRRQSKGHYTEETIRKPDKLHIYGNAELGGKTSVQAGWSA